MAISKNKNKIIEERQQLSRIRRIKLVREIANGKQRRISEWVS